MFRRRDIPPVLLLVLLIILVMLTLSQILVVHNGHYGRNIHSIRRLQMELKELDVNLQSMMLQDVPSIELNRRLLQNEINARRVADIIRDASMPDPRFLPSSSSVDLASRRRTNLSFDSPVDDRHLVDDVTFAAPPPFIPSTPGAAHELKTHDQKTFVGDQVTWDQLPASDEAAAAAIQLPTDVIPLLSDDLTALPLDFDGQGTNPGSLKNESDLARSSSSPLQLELLVGGRSDRNGSSVVNSSSARTNESTAFSTVVSRVSYCPPVPPGLRGRIFIDFKHKHDYSETDVIAQNPLVLSGGIGRPTSCTARHKVAVVVPYRDRKAHLVDLLSHLHPMLQRQQLNYRIYVVEQYGDYTFNKARIMNIAFVEALKQYSFQCFVFHDVDLVPEDDRNMYSCPVQPRHMSVAIDEMGYKLAYPELVGGVLNMRTEHFQRVNGYSNLYWGWGAEDDDMAYRIMYVGLKITRPPDSIARYKMIKHTKRKPSDWRKRTKLLYTGTRRFQFDGLNSLHYRLVNITNTALYTHILVDIGRPPRGF